MSELREKIAEVIEEVMIDRGLNALTPFGIETKYSHTDRILALMPKMMTREEIDRLVWDHEGMNPEYLIEALAGRIPVKEEKCECTTYPNGWLPSMCQKCGKKIGVSKKEIEPLDEKYMKGGFADKVNEIIGVVNKLTKEKK